MITLRTYAFLSSLQPQLASYVATISRGFLPVPFDASLFIEISPGISINTLTDVALKATAVKPAIQIVERAFGLLEIHHAQQSEVLEAGKAILDHIGIQEKDRIKPSIVSNQVIRSIESYQAAILNKNRYGSMIIAGDSLFILETEPAAYVAYAANEAEKAARIKLVDVIPYGAYGRLYISGKEDEVDEASKAAIKCLQLL